MGVAHRKIWYHHAWKENCIITYSHPMPKKGVVILELGQESAQLIQKHWRLTVYHHLLFFITLPQARQGKPFLLTTAAEDLTFFSLHMWASEGCLGASWEQCYRHHGAGTYLRLCHCSYCLASSFRTEKKKKKSVKYHFYSSAEVWTGQKLKFGL